MEMVYGSHTSKIYRCPGNTTDKASRLLPNVDNPKHKKRLSKFRLIRLNIVVLRVR